MHHITHIFRYHSHKKKLDKIFIIQHNLDGDTYGKVTETQLKCAGLHPKKEKIYLVPTN